MIYERPKYKNQYENFIGGEWIAPSSGEYIENISPVDGKLLTKIPRSNEKDVDLAVEAAKKGFEEFKHICNSKKCFIKQNCRYSRGKFRDFGSC